MHYISGEPLLQIYEVFETHKVIDITYISFKKCTYCGKVSRRVIEEKCFKGTIEDFKKWKEITWDSYNLETFLDAVIGDGKYEIHFDATYKGYFCDGCSADFFR